MKNILPISEGSDISLVDLLYYDGYRHQNQYKDDVLFIVYKDKNGKKKIEMKEKPEVEIYFTKPEYRNDWTMPREYVEIDKVYSDKVRYKGVVNRIFKELKECNDKRSQILKETYIKAHETGAYRSKKEVFKFQHTFMSDLPIEDYYRIMISNHYNTDIAHKVNKAYLDIEADIYKLTSMEIKQNKDKVNAITMIFENDTISGSDKKMVYTFLLRDHERYPQQQYFEDHLNEFIKQCHDEFDEIEIVRNGKKKIIKTNGKYNIKLFDDEGEMLEAVFKVINIYKPDMLGIWNIAYDLPKMYNRLVKCGRDPVNIMSDPAFPKQARFVDMRIDDRSNIEMFNRKTFIKMTSMVKYIDQMLLYASTRKGMKAYGSNELDNIAFIELGLTKRKFKKGVTIHNVAIKDYWNFVLYGINDVWLQQLIEEVTNDITTIFYDSNSASTAIENISKQTIYLRNIYYAYRYKVGYVSGNNVNNDYVTGNIDVYADIMKEIYESHKKNSEDDDDDEDNDDQISDELDEEIASIAKNLYEDSVDAKLILTGGLVGNPNLKSANGEELVSGVKSKHVFKHSMDMDYSSEYPWIKYTRSISKSTQYGRLIINKKISNRQNPYNVKTYIPGAEFISDYISQDYISFCNVWFGLKNADEYIKEIKKKHDIK